MAGIGFELRKLTTKQSFSGWCQAYFSAMLISAGPWIISIMSLMILNYLLHGVLPSPQIRLFTSSTTHVYAFALIIIGPIQLVLTRYTSDCFSAKNREAIFPSFVGAMLLTSAVALVWGGVFFLGFVTAPLAYGAAAAALLVYVSGVFIASTYLSALRQYHRIVLAFFVGFGICIGASYGLARVGGLTGAMMGFLAGQFVLFALLAIQVLREFGKGAGPKFEFMGAFRRFPDLMLCGLFYNLAIWADKFLFWWFSQSSVRIAGALRAALDYDLAIYLSLLSIAPGMAVFFLEVETTFAEHYQSFFDAIRNGRPLREIIRAKREIVLSLRHGFDRLLKVQGFTTAALVLFAEPLAGWFHIGYVQTGIFRITLFGALLLVIFLAMLTVLYYFDDRRGALLCSLIFLVTNAGLSALTLVENEAWYGFGFVMAAALSLFMATARVNSHLEKLEYNTFCRAET